MERAGLPPGTELGGYEILAPLGAGGMGAVYRAQDGAGNQVALKLLHPSLSLDPANRERLRREVAALQRLRHPSVARVLDAETDSTEAFIVTELVDGPTLAERVETDGPLDAQELADLAAGLAESLTYIHGQGVLHRDLKPPNVMVTPDPVLIDFGIAQEEGADRVTSTGLVLGTPGYVAPELLGGGEPTTAADWWGFAAVLAFAATGRPPFGVGTLEAILARTQAGDPDLNGLPARTSLALASMLRADPAERATATEVVDQLASVARGTQSTLALDVGAWAKPGRTRTFAAPGTTAVMPLGAPPPRPQVPEATAVGPQPTSSAPVGEPEVASAALGEVGVVGAGPAIPVGPVIPVGPAIPARPAVPVGPGIPAGSEPTDFLPDVPVPDGEPVAISEAIPPVLAEGDSFGGLNPYVPPAPPRRMGTVLAFGLALTAAAMLWPGISFVTAIVFTVLVRTVGLDVAAVHQRAVAKGEPEQTHWRAIATAPWHLLRALVSVVPALIVAASVTIIVGGISWWSLDTERLMLAGNNPPWVFSLVLGFAVGAGLVGLWWGPFSLTHRWGARWVLAKIAPGTSGAIVVWAVAVALIAVVGLFIASGHSVNWWPLPGAPNLS